MSNESGKYLLVNNNSNDCQSSFIVYYNGNCRNTTNSTTTDWFIEMATLYFGKNRNNGIEYNPILGECQWSFEWYGGLKGMYMCCVNELVSFVGNDYEDRINES